MPCSYWSSQASSMKGLSCMPAPPKNGRCYLIPRAGGRMDFSLADGHPALTAIRKRNRREVLLNLPPVPFPQHARLVTQGAETSPAVPDGLHQIIASSENMVGLGTVGREE